MPETRQFLITFQHFNPFLCYRLNRQKVNHNGIVGNIEDQPTACEIPGAIPQSNENVVLKIASPLTIFRAEGGVRSGSGEYIQSSCLPAPTIHNLQYPQTTTASNHSVRKDEPSGAKMSLTIQFRPLTVAKKTSSI